MNHQEMIEIALDAGALKATVIDIDSIVLNATFRDICKSNGCGMYGRCWMCPPDIGDIEPLMESKSLYKCLTCFACVDRCPRNVEPAKLVEAVRLMVIRKQGQNHMKPDDIPAQVDEDTPQQLLMSALRKYSK